jgi:hypothetical protein
MAYTPTSPHFRNRLTHNDFNGLEGASPQLPQTISDYSDDFQALGFGVRAAHFDRQNIVHQPSLDHAFREACADVKDAPMSFGAYRPDRFD